MRWFIVLLLLAALLAAVRIIFAIRRARSQPRNDWDAHMVRDLRAAGANAFTPYQVDFFFGLSDEAACAALRSTLEPEGFSVDIRNMGGEEKTGYSLHAAKRLRISVSDMQEHSQRFRVLAEQYGGHYDGWTADLSRT